MNQNGNMNINEFKGIYYNDNKQQKFFEGGAHFSYKELYHLLEILQSPKEKSDSSRIVKSERMKPKTRNAKSTNDFQADDSRNVHTFDIPKRPNISNHNQYSKNMNLSMYNNVYLKRNINDEKESIIPKKQISIIKSTNSNTRNSNNHYEKDNYSTINNHHKQAMSMCSANREFQCNRYTSSKNKKMFIPTKVLVQQIIMNSKKMLQFTSRIKENLAKPKNNLPCQILTQNKHCKQNGQRNKISSIDFDQIGLYKKSFVAKSRNQKSQRDFKYSNMINNNSFLKGNSVEKQPIGKTIDLITRNKMSSFSSSTKHKTSVAKKNKTNANEITSNNASRNINVNKSNSNKTNKLTQCAYSNYAQKYLRKILKNDFEINKRIQPYQIK